MVDIPIDVAAGIARETAVRRHTFVAVIHRSVRRTAAWIQAEAELSCIDQRLREDAGLTREGYLNAARRTAS